MQLKNTSREVTRRLHEPRLTLFRSKKEMGRVLSDTLLTKLTSHNVILEFTNFEKWLVNSDSHHRNPLVQIYKKSLVSSKSLSFTKQNETLKSLKKLIIH